jgi:hypothetical protein
MPVVVLLLSFFMGLQKPSSKVFMFVSLISLGVGIASYGEAEFDLAGFVVQVSRTTTSLQTLSNVIVIQGLALIVEGSRLTLIQIVLQGIGMDPITYVFFPRISILHLTSHFLQIPLLLRSSLSLLQPPHPPPY